VGPPSLGESVEPAPKQLHDLSQETSEGVVLLSIGMGLDEGVRGFPQLPEAVSQSQGQETGPLLEGPLGYGPGKTVAEAEEEQAVAIG
jgi:hypothetical protein